MCEIYFSVHNNNFANKFNFENSLKFKRCIIDFGVVGAREALLSFKKAHFV